MPDIQTSINTTLSSLKESYIVLILTIITLVIIIISFIYYFYYRGLKKKNVI